MVIDISSDSSHNSSAFITPSEEDFIDDFLRSPPRARWAAPVPIDFFKPVDPSSELMAGSPGPSSDTNPASNSGQDAEAEAPVEV